jgi:ABC-type uncharacterized transport system permease subunit
LALLLSLIFSIEILFANAFGLYVFRHSLEGESTTLLVIKICTVQKIQESELVQRRKPDLICRVCDHC